MPALESLGIQVPVKPDGAFYVFGDVSAHTSDSSNFSTELLHRAHVAAVPGIDFGTAHASKSMRFAYTTGLNKLEEAVRAETVRRYELASEWEKMTTPGAGTGKSKWIELELAASESRRQALILLMLHLSVAAQEVDDGELHQSGSS